MTIGTIFSVSISAQQDYDIPDWVKNTAGWWADDKISEIIIDQNNPQTNCYRDS